MRRPVSACRHLGEKRKCDDDLSVVNDFFFFWGGGGIKKILYKGVMLREVVIMK